LLPAEARAHRPGIPLAAGQSFEVSAIGWWGPAGEALVRVEDLCPVQPSGAALCVTGSPGPTSFSPGRKRYRQMAMHTGELVVSPWPGLPSPAWILDHSPLEGSALIMVSN
jgi:hypothetical protein